jgi:hypothetical protein
MKKDKHIRKYIVTTLLMLFVSVVSIFAQANKQYGTRISDTESNKALRENVILELDSKDKGFMLPRVTTVQRDRLVKDKTADNGLAIYNIDIDCVEFWSERTEKWMSVCGSLPPATLDLVNGACSKISFTNIAHENVKDQWQQGKALPDNAFMLIEVKVESIGTYQISASTDNGYFFSAEGQFQAIGTYNISLKAMGTPINGYVQNNGGKTGDKFKFMFNGKESTGCPNVQLKIVPADLEFTIKSAPSNTYVAKGTYIVKKEALARNGNKINVDINVTSPGKAVVTATSNSDLAMKFTGSVQADVIGDYTVELEPVIGENIPRTNIATSYDLAFSTNTKNQAISINSQKASIVISETKIEPMGTKASFGMTKYYAGEILTNNHTIVLPIKVLAAGTTSLRLKDVTGNYEFEAKDVVLDNPVQPTDEQLITFKAKSLIALPNSATVLELALSGDQSRLIISGDDKKVNLPIEVKPVAYTIKCDEIKTNRSTIFINKPIEKTFSIQVPVNVTVDGEYEIKTETAVEGIIFSSNVNGVKQRFGSTGDKIITLYAVDETIAPKNKGVTVTKIITNDANSSINTCTPQINLKVGNVDLKILYAAYSREIQSIERYFLQGNRFGETGSIVETGAVSVEKVLVDIPYQDVEFNNATNLAKRKALADMIKSGDYNFIILDNTYSLFGGFDQQIADALDYYVKNFKGFVIIPSTQGRSSTNDFIGGLESDSYGSGAKRTQVYTWIGALNGVKMSANTNSANDDNIGFIVPNNRFKFSNHYPQPAGYGLYRYKKDVKINTNGGDFIPIVRSRETDGPGVGSVFIHKTYNVIFAPMLDTTQDRDFVNATHYLDQNKQYDMLIPMPVHNGQKRAYTTFQGNLFVGIITALMNQ